MDYWHLSYQLPAIVAGTTLVAYLSPVKLAHRVMPLAMFLVALIVLNLPVVPDMGLALTLPAAILANLLGISWNDHEAMDVAPVVAKAKSAAQAVRERVRKPAAVEPEQVTEFVSKPYPNPWDENGYQAPDDEDELPEDAGAIADDDLDDVVADQPAPSPADEARERLAAITGGKTQQWYGQKMAGQRPGRPGGLRNQHAPTRSFVPSL